MSGSSRSPLRRRDAGEPPRGLGPGAVLLGAVGLLVAAPLHASAQPAVPGDAEVRPAEAHPAAQANSGDERWLPWLGCWAPAEEGVGPADTPEGGEEGAPEADAGAPELVCFHPRDDAPGVLVRGVTDGQVTSREPLVADGKDRPVERGGCEGVERARWSEDGKRLFIRSELDCGADVSRVQTSILAFHGADGWMEIQAVEAGGSDPAAGVRHFQAVDRATLEEVGLPDPARDRELALETARRAATAPLTAEHVREAVERVHPEAVKALILETDARIPLDAETLVALDDAGVPGDVIDLMVAMDNPHRFQLDRDAQLATRAVEERPGTAARGPYPLLVPDPFYRPFGFRRSPYAFRFHSVYGLGARFGGTYGSFGPVVVVPVERQRGGRAVRGDGYTRGDGPPSADRRASRRGDGSASVNRDRPPRRSDTSAGSSGGGRATSQGATQGSSSDDNRRRARSRSSGNNEGN